MLIELLCHHSFSTTASWRVAVICWIRLRRELLTMLQQWLGTKVLSKTTFYQTTLMCEHMWVAISLHTNRGVIICIRTYKSNHWSLVKHDNQINFHFFYPFSHDDQKMEQRDKQCLEIVLSMPKTIVDQMTPSISARSVCFPHISVSLLLLWFGKAGDSYSVTICVLLKYCWAIYQKNFI